jgi:hypothetical protein
VDGACIPAEPIQFMCLREAGDRVCDPEENSCTSLTIRKRAIPLILDSFGARFRPPGRKSLPISRIRLPSPRRWRIL